jgi:hypothetical protein
MHMQIEAYARVELDVTPEEGFDLAADYRNFARFLRRNSVIPGIERAEMVAGAEPGKGAHRRITLSDGNVLEEEILVFDRPARHAYRWLHPPAWPFSMIVRGGEGSWSFTRSERGPGTTLVWKYRFELRSILAYPVGVLVVVLFRRWMAQGLERIRVASADRGQRS